MSTTTLSAKQAANALAALTTISKGDVSNGVVIRQPNGEQQVLAKQYKLTGTARLRIAQLIIALQPEVDAIDSAVHAIRTEFAKDDEVVPPEKLPEFRAKCNEAGDTTRKLSLPVLTEKELALDKNEISPEVLVALMPVLKLTP